MWFWIWVGMVVKGNVAGNKKNPTSLAADRVIFVSFILCWVQAILRDFVD
jgi:hypothetical protein